MEELRARGMPLGLMPGMLYEEKETSLAPTEHVLFYSDGLAEAHDRLREMLGFPRVRALVGNHAGGDGFVESLLDALASFTGPDWEQEDDVTLVTLRREGAASVDAPEMASASAGRAVGA